MIEKVENKNDKLSHVNESLNEALIGIILKLLFASAKALLTTSCLCIKRCSMYIHGCFNGCDYINIAFQSPVWMVSTSLVICHWNLVYYICNSLFSIYSELYQIRNTLISGQA